MSDTPTWGEVLRAAVAAGLADVHTSMPAKVLSYDSTKQSVSLQPLIRRGYSDAEGDRQVESLPVINGVPVSFPGSGAYSITWPIAVDDTGMVFFSEGSVDKWKSYGGEVDPLDERRFNLSDAIFVPGVRPFSSALSGSALHATAMVVGSTLIHLGAGASHALIKGDSYASAEATALAAVAAAFTAMAADIGLNGMVTVTSATPIGAAATALAAFSPSGYLSSVSKTS